ncbi:hypothetical protein RJ641_017451 [Dillenia turbinata]|uniref:Uncharacterized protein n=1 Tax=Dillenia turbinata TaxID=194707 RepID=A0AAN8UR81_9MAGN
MASADVGGGTGRSYGCSCVNFDLPKVIASADAIFLKAIEHNRNDEDFLEPEGNGLFAETGLKIDLVMIAQT